MRKIAFWIGLAGLIWWFASACEITGVLEIKTPQCYFPPPVLPIGYDMVVVPDSVALGCPYGIETIDALGKIDTTWTVVTIDREIWR